MNNAFRSHWQCQKEQQVPSSVHYEIESLTLLDKSSMTIHDDPAIILTNHIRLFSI